MKRNKFTAITMVCFCVMAICTPVYGAAQENTALKSGITQSRDYSNACAPYVTAEMCTPEYWVSKQAKADKLLMKDNEIAQMNTAIKSTPETNMYTLMDMEESFDGKALVASMASVDSPEGMYLNGKPVSETYYEAIRKNIVNAEATRNMKLRYGIVVNHTVMKAYPYSDFLSDDPKDADWDQFVNTSAFVNEPLVVYLLTADRKFAYVTSGTYSGWIPFEDIAVCKDKKEWEDAFKADNFLVVTGEKIYLEASGADKEISEKKLLMGTVLPLEINQEGTITNRSTWNNYVVKLPTRGKDGSFSQKLALIPANRDVSVGYLPLTQENIISQAFKLLGNRYGWGGMLDSQDCSQFVKDVYSCFGLTIPRDTTAQYHMPVKKHDLTTLSTQEKSSVMDALLPGTILQFPGHEMLYLGKVEGRYYTINSASNLLNPVDEKAGTIRVRTVIINELTVKRKNGKTWYDELNYAIIPWEFQD